MDNQNAIQVNDKLTIPRSELEFSFSTSGGPGGQHANKAETKVTLRFDVANSPSLSEAVRARLLRQLSSRLDKDGVLQIQVQESRSQWRNRKMAEARFKALLAGALRPRKKRRKTRPSRAANERRLRNKKRRGRLKRERGRDWRDQM